MFTLYQLVADIPSTIIMIVWVLAVIYLIAKLFYNIAVSHGYSSQSGAYFGRKVIHLLAGGVVAILLPYLFHEPVLPLIMAAMLSAFLYLPHRNGKLMYWFQDPNNEYEVHFTIMWGLLVFFTWFIDSTFLLAVVPILFMAWGDGVTGIVRNFIYKKRVKGWQGSVAMLVVSVPIGMLYGWAGIIAAVLATLAEKQGYIDDNITVPLVAIAVLLLAHFFAPGLTASLW
ncbi:MAG: dolichol kinase [Nitrososphaerota archaeon]|jgi:dolichol kinase|nr:dolichol kinase [Nitrososphaerota archaeon]MDG6929796.1 dolichol kinase [Nitrososphaerota archaeon]